MSRKEIIWLIIVHVATLHTALFPAFTLTILFSLVFTIHQDEQVSQFTLERHPGLLAVVATGGICETLLRRGCVPVRPSCFLSNINSFFPKELISCFLDLGVNIECIQILKVFLFLQLLSPPCLVNFNKNPRQVLSTLAALRIRCRSPYTSSCPIGVYKTFAVWLPVACSLSPFLEHGFGQMQIRGSGCILLLLSWGEGHGSRALSSTHLGRDQVCMMAHN